MCCSRSRCVKRLSSCAEGWASIDDAEFVLVRDRRALCGPTGVALGTFVFNLSRLARTVVAHRYAVLTL